MERIHSPVESAAFGGGRFVGTHGEKSLSPIRDVDHDLLEFEVTGQNAFFEARIQVVMPLPGARAGVKTTYWEPSAIDHAVLALGAARFYLVQPGATEDQ